MNELRLIRLAMALGEHRNFARAADALGMSQPTVSRGIMELERAMGVPLFDRTTRGVLPTSYGRVLLERGDSLLRSQATLYKEIRALAGLEAGSITISAGPFASEISVATAIARLSLAHPKLEIRCRTTDPTAVLRDVLEERADVGVAHLVSADEADRLVVLPSPKLKLYFACRPGHPLTRRANPTFMDAFDYPIVSNVMHGPPAASINQRDGAAHADASFTNIFVPRIVVDSGEISRRIARDSDALAPSTMHVLADEIAAGRLVALDIDAPVMRTIHSIFYLRERTLAPAAQAFIEGLRQVEAELAAGELIAN